ncbi:TetR/AcrR family transcriptional regulator [Mycobacterium cookii]|uniref:TetR family transcriptional regulator n=1 Tax=Mycobacterium cookii TaxID=1775 RepID=A0A7I7KXT4_9MYCO|nr:TetR family transcriptional regulator [Mycobacterium cookii]MCV7330885.1 TetR family transcriptional regulator [Mycobacterium cookii]BBX46519.1 TetR family transcriptional regulator [Mycobacterium cookii]
MAEADPHDDRRLTAKGQATRDRIVQIAAELILSEGVSSFNMDALRRAASVSGSQLAHYFTDKGELIRAVVERQTNVVLDFHRQPKLRTLDTFDDFERWIDLNMRYLRRTGYSGTPTYHALAGQLGKSDATTRDTLAAGYWQWIMLLENSFQRMKDRHILISDADARKLALLVVSAHQGGATLSFTYRAEWPHADALRFALNYARLFAVNPAERVARAARRPRGRREIGGSAPDDAASGLTRKGRATRARIVDVAADLMFRRGVADTSIDDVRTTASVSGSQISHYFDGKRDLTRKVITARREHVQSFHTQPRLGDLDSLAALQAWADLTMADVDTVYRRGGCVYGSLAGELIGADAEIHQDLAAGYDRWIALFKNGLTEMRRRGDLRPDADPRHLAVSLVAAHQGGAMVTFITEDPEPLRATIYGAVDYARSFAPPAPRG